jgi:hypothetical protein
MGLSLSEVVVREGLREKRLESAMPLGESRLLRQLEAKALGSKESAPARSVQVVLT